MIILGRQEDQFPLSPVLSLISLPLYSHPPSHSSVLLRESQRFGWRESWLVSLESIRYFFPFPLTCCDLPTSRVVSLSLSLALSLSLSLSLTLSLFHIYSVHCLHQASSCFPLLSFTPPGYFRLLFPYPNIFLFFCPAFPSYLLECGTLWLSLYVGSPLWSRVGSSLCAHACKYINLYVYETIV